MKNSITRQISLTSARDIRANADNPFIVSDELFKGAQNGHKFSVGQHVKLVGLVDFSEFNGQPMKITAIREDGARGRAYYIEGKINKFLNWVYEYRLADSAS